MGPSPLSQALSPNPILFRDWKARLINRLPREKMQLEHYGSRLQPGAPALPPRETPLPSSPWPTPHPPTPPLRPGITHRGEIYLIFLGKFVILTSPKVSQPGEA